MLITRLEMKGSGGENAKVGIEKNTRNKSLEITSHLTFSSSKQSSPNKPNQ